MHHSVHLSDDPDDFLKLALRVQRLLGGDFGECVDGLDQSYWDLHVAQARLTIHREHYLGVCVFCADDAASLHQLHRLAELEGLPLR
jgi:hypothetical protein